MYLCFQKSAEEADSLREQCVQKDEQMKELKKEIDRLLIDLGVSGVNDKLASQRLSNAANESNVSVLGMMRVVRFYYVQSFYLSYPISDYVPILKDLSSM